jgi:hypothetical protein
VSFLVSPLTLPGIDDSDHPLGSCLYLEVPDLYCLLVAPPMPVQSLYQVKLKSEQFVGVGAVSADIVVSHVPLALTQKAKSREPRRDDFNRDKGLQFRPTVE